jgi:membrane dipeptidase
MAATGMIDLHCDTLIFEHKGERSLASLESHVSLSKLPHGTKWAQFFAIFIRDHLRGQQAKDYFESYCDYFYKEMERHQTVVEPCRSFQEVKKAFAGHKFAAILTVEGGAVLAGETERAAYIAKKGVKALTITWNGPNEICSGHDTKEGITPFGREVIPELERHGIIIDTSHLNDRGFEDLCTIARKPFIASHSNSRAICAHPRNLPDEHFKEIARRGGLVGLNYYVNFIKDDGQVTGLDDLFRHVEHFLKLGGENTICLGSDYDGATIHHSLDSVEKSLGLYDYFCARGLGHELADKILFRNAWNYFSQYL